MTRPATHRRKRILITLTVLVATASYNPAYGQELGQLSVNPYAPNSTANPYSPAGSPYSATSVRNPYGQYGSPYSDQSATNPYATDAPKLYDEEGNYRGKLSANPYDPESVSNPYGRYGSEHSADSINNPYGAGNEYRTDSPRNPYGVGMKIVAGGQEEVDDDATSPADSPTFLPQPLPALKALTVETDPSD
jgi:hypothetical protein